MSRPTLTTMKEIEHGQESWDSDVNDNFSDVKAFVEGQPFAIKYYTDETGLPAAGSYDWCLAVIQSHTTHGTGPFLACSNGTAWKFVYFDLG